MKRINENKMVAMNKLSKIAKDCEDVEKRQEAASLLDQMNLGADVKEEVKKFFKSLHKEEKHESIDSFWEDLESLINDVNDVEEADEPKRYIINIIDKNNDDVDQIQFDNVVEASQEFKRIKHEQLDKLVELVDTNTEEILATNGEEIKAEQEWGIDEEFKDTMINPGEAQMTDVCDLDMPAPLAATISTDEDGEILTMEKVVDKVEDMTNAIVDKLDTIANELNQPEEKEPVVLDDETIEDVADEVADEVSDEIVPEETNDEAEEIESDEPINDEEALEESFDEDYNIIKQAVDADMKEILDPRNQGDHWVTYDKLGIDLFNMFDIPENVETMEMIRRAVKELGYEDKVIEESEVELEESLNEDYDTIKQAVDAVKKALEDLGVVNPQINGTDYGVEITYDDHGNLFSDESIRWIISRFENEIQYTAEQQEKEALDQEDEFKQYLRDSQYEDLNQAKQEIDKAKQDGKSIEEVKTIIDLSTDNDQEKKQAQEYAVNKLTESLLATSQTCKLKDIKK